MDNSSASEENSPTRSSAQSSADTLDLIGNSDAEEASEDRQSGIESPGSQLESSSGESEGLSAAQLSEVRDYLLQRLPDLLSTGDLPSVITPLSLETYIVPRLGSLLTSIDEQFGQHGLAMSAQQRQ